MENTITEPWWLQAIAKWQAVRARGEAFRSEHDKQPKIESEARRVAAGIDGDYVHLLELCGNWPGQEMEFLQSVERMGHYDVMPFDKSKCECGSSTFHDFGPCAHCESDNIDFDWRAGK